jgi:hypothetical protein
MARLYLAVGKHLGHLQLYAFFLPEGLTEVRTPSRISTTSINGMLNSVGTSNLSVGADKNVGELMDQRRRAPKLTRRKRTVLRQHY